MQELFDDPDMAVGYLRSRPALHSQIAGRIRARLGVKRQFSRALDVGCGAGLSTKVLNSFARRTFGLEPASNMIKNAEVPSGELVQGRAEGLPFARGSINIVSAAGSLNWVDLDEFFEEVDRVLAPEGWLIIYDFEPGRQFQDSESLSNWFAGFEESFPPPSCREISPANLAVEAGRLTMCDYELFQLDLTMSQQDYLEYILTETNVVEAFNRGLTRSEIRDWCSESLVPVFQDQERVILFEGFIAYLNKQT